MRILCAIGIRRGAELVRRVARVARPDDELTLVHVVDTGERHAINHLEGHLRPHHPPREELNAAEQEAGEAMLEEAMQEAARSGIQATSRLERGRPEQVIVSLAGDLGVDLVALLGREAPQSHPVQGPPSVGHTARFIVDHAPSDVLLFREKP
jgi:nucleotide-binding universal stress UspA family protein